MTAYYNENDPKAAATLRELKPSQVQLACSSFCQEAYGMSDKEPKPFQAILNLPSIFRLRGVHAQACAQPRELSFQRMIRIALGLRDSTYKNAPMCCLEASFRAIEAYILSLCRGLLYGIRALFCCFLSAYMLLSKFVFGCFVAWQKMSSRTPCTDEVLMCLFRRFSNAKQRSILSCKKLCSSVQLKKSYRTSMFFRAYYCLHLLCGKL